MFAAPKSLMLSFVIPAYNEEFELPLTLAAIKAAVGQDRQYEIIVVDDASTDATAQIAKDAGAKVVSINRRHIAAARNAGARASTGDILFFVDADTHIKARHVVDAISALNAGYSGGGARITTDGTTPFWGRVLIKLFSVVYFGMNLAAGAFLFTTRANFDKIGGLDESLFVGEEVFFSTALKKLGRFKILREPVVTSGRKLRMYSAAQILRRSCFLIFGGLGGWRSRERLDLWYDGKRETKSAFASSLGRDEST
jgi:glycosyltransferase involved in cell wall biosynthesis